MTKVNAGNGSNLEVSERVTRRRFSAEYEMGMLESANRGAPDERGSLAALEQRVRLTRIAYGMPLGGDLEYADRVTVGICIENRRAIG